MNIFILLIISFVLILFLKDSLNLFFYIKIYLGYLLIEEVKLFDCYFCLIMWIFVIVLIFLFNWVFIFIGFVIVKIIDKLWN